VTSPDPHSSGYANGLYAKSLSLILSGIPPPARFHRQNLPRLDFGIEPRGVLGQAKALGIEVTDDPRNATYAAGEKIAQPSL
jgi:hypothetical protein